MNVWKLFANSKILPEKNFKVDSIDTYLATLTTIELTGDTEKEAPMYIKHNLEVFVKINKNQSTLNFFNTANNYNYMSIKNTDDTYPVYYFILKKQWVAKDTIGLILRMDTVNTFKTERNSFTISDRTLVNREHKDRLFRQIGYVPYRKPTVFAPPYNQEVRLAKTTSITGDFEANNALDIVVRKYNANGRLVDTYKGMLLSYYVEVGLGYYFKLEDEGGGLVWTKSKNSFNADYDAGIYYTVEFTAFLADFPNDCDWFNGVRYSYIQRKIDLYPEGINPVLFKRELFEIEGDLDWYLIYMNQNDPSDSLVNPVDCLLCASKPIAAKGISNVFLIADAGTYFNFHDYNAYAILYADNPDATIYYTVEGDATVRSIKLNYNEKAGDRVNVRFYENADEKVRMVIGYNTKQTGYENFAAYGESEVNGNIASITIISGQTMYESTPSIDEDTPIEDIQEETPIDISVNDELVYLRSIDEIDKTDPKLIKIIKLPYCPTKYDTSTGDLGEGEWEWDGTLSLPKLKNLNTKFFSTIEPEDNILDVMKIDEDEFTLDTDKDPYFESKLFHSDYYQPKFVYDSFGFVFMLERISSNIPSTFKINFVMTGTIHSHFLFEFADYQCPDYAQQDYNNILNIARNNEVVIYNQQFMNYLRAGFNYDVKAKERTIAGTWISTALSAIGSIASFASTPVTGGMGLAAGISLATTTLASFSNSVIQTANAEANIEAKMAQLKNQATSVEGSDDVDLMSYYANNRAKMVLYEVSPKMKECMFDVFYYTGYIAGVMRLPDFTSRYWFNFVSCDLALEVNVNIPDNCLEDLKARYRDGITVMHVHSGSYDWNREKENWENSII